MDFDNLLNRQVVHARYIRNFMVNFEKLGRENHTKSTITARLKLLEEYWQKFQTNNADLYVLADATTLTGDDYFKNDEYSAIELLYTQHCGALTEMLPVLKIGDAPIAQTVHNGTSNIPLPRIAVPKFNGSSLEWESFRDMFVAIIHTKAELSNVQKLHYLKCSLTGEAEQLLRNVRISDDMIIVAY